MRSIFLLPPLSSHSDTYALTHGLSRHGQPHSQSHHRVSALRSAFSRARGPDDATRILPVPTSVVEPEQGELGTAQLGAVVVDMGHLCTSVTAWSEGAPTWMGHVQAGGRHISADLRQIFKLSAEQADQVVVDGLSGVSELEAEGASLAIGRRRIDRHKASRVIQARLEDIFQRIRNRLTTQAWWRVAENSVILTGGAALIPGTAAQINAATASG